MQNLNIVEGNETPEVNMDVETGLIEFKGRSLPEDVNSFYQPVIKWIDEYLQSPAKETSVVFQLEYFNTASSKVIYEILMKLDKITSDQSDVKVSWYYETDDEDMLDIGKEYKENLQLNFNMISIDAIL